MLCLELVDKPVDDALVPVVATEVVVAGGRADLDDAVADLEEGDVEGAATEVEDQDGLLLLALVEAVGEGSRGGLVDDAQDVETGDGAGFLRGLTLGVVEVRRDGDDRVGDVLTEVASASRLSFISVRALISCGVYFLSSMATVQSVPMWRLTERMVRSTLVTAWFLAG